ncbi:hypothetical protein [Domibacillus enclensis]|uniref:DNA-binding transcriptional regulator, MerR family n=1 Tax=Domibacillus enclensis TaxID=1017273 RepID=A0A1N7C379_9BACI|nr:hypothetical protein [Domibacillus enclensis]OXS74221.1 hypothetical protein B1B05_17250 [Domibacillus enclensis]SIR58022.1 DNA-binding transcriptional regulator, MerR family [Domibacillus enclensis]
MKQGKNGYNYFDQPALERLILIRRLNREQGYSLKQIEYYLAIGEEKIRPEPMQGATEDIRGDLAVILERLDLQEQFNQALVTKLDEQQHYIKESLNRRDHLLLESLKASHQARKAELKKKRFFSWIGTR